MLSLQPFNEFGVGCDVGFCIFLGEGWRALMRLRGVKGKERKEEEEKAEQPR